ncbi:MAG: cyanophycinase [Bdellovibrio sp.]
MDSQRVLKKKKAEIRHARVLHPHGTLIIIGGAEDRTGEKKILLEIALRTKNSKMVIITAASDHPMENWHEYKQAFKDLGVKSFAHVHLNQPEDAHQLNLKEIFENAKTVFFSGGDQLRLTSRIGGTAVIENVLAVFAKGGTLAGTSAGASVMGEIMLVGGENEVSHKVGNWMMAPGLKFVENVIIDQHFAQRGRIGRLLGAVALNPGILGIGIDESTAIIVENEKFRILGDNAVYILDGSEVTYTNIAEASEEKTMSLHDVKLHVLAESEEFDLITRKIISPNGSP